MTDDSRGPAWIVPIKRWAFSPYGYTSVRALHRSSLPRTTRQMT